MSTNKVNEKLHALFIAYAKQLPAKISGIENLWKYLLHDWNQKQFEIFHREVHNLCGSAATYGYKELGHAARQLEVYLKSLLESSSISIDQQNEITNLLSRLKTTISLSPLVTNSILFEVS